METSAPDPALRKGEGGGSSARKSKVGVRRVGTHPTSLREVAPET